MQIMQKSLACFFALFFGCLAASAQAPALLKDLNNGLASGNPRGITTVGNTVYFSADDVVHGRELWKTTGTDASTVMVMDISINGSSNPANFCNVNGTVFFTVNTANGGYQLWKTDGTVLGTQFVYDLFLAGENGSFAKLTACNDKLFFRSYVSVVPPPGGAPSLDLKLYVSDGTPAGTKILGPSLSLPQNLTAVGTTLFLSGTSTNCVNGNQLLKIVGETIYLVKSLQFPNDFGYPPGNFINANGFLFFSAQNSFNGGRQIWKSDGTSDSTKAMTNIASGYGVSEIAHVNGTVFFSGVEAALPPNSAGEQLFRLNSLNNVTKFPTASTRNLTVFGNRLVFTHESQAGAILYSVGANDAALTILLNNWASNLTVAGTTLFFVSGNAATGRELWKSNTAGTGPVQDFMPGPADANISDISARGSEVFFASDGSGSTIGGNELRSSNGTLNGIVTVKNIGRAGSFPKEFVQMGSNIYFTADDVDAGRELWKTNGTIGNAVRVADLIPGTTGSNPSNLIVITNGAIQTLFFEAKSLNNGRELFKLENALNAAPKRISDIIVGAGNAGIGNMTNVNGVLHFTATQNLLGLGDRIFKVNAIRTGVETTGGPMTFANNLKAMGSTLFFTQSPQVGPRLLNKLVNGLASQIGMFAVVAGQADPIPQQLTVVGTRLFFTVADGPITRIWVTNAAATSVSQVSSHNASDLTNFNGRLVFTVPSDNIAGQSSIFRVNTAFNGADLLATSSSIGGLRATNTDLFFFRAFNQGEVYLSKITTVSNSVVILRAFSKGNTGIATEMIVAGSNLFFTMNNAGTGHELWKSNGDITALVSDIRPGIGHSNIQSLAVCGTDLFFSANNLTNGQEPWKLANATALVGGGGEEEGGEREAVQEVMAIPTSEAPEIKVYPNPTANFVNVDLPQNEMTGTLSIVSASGQMVRSVQSSEGESSVQMDVQDLPKGVYLVRFVQSDDQVVVKKLIVQ